MTRKLPRATEVHITGASDGVVLPVTLESAPAVTYTQATGTKAVSGDNVLVAAPSAGNRLVVKELVVQNESSTETTVILKSGSTAKWRAKLAANASLSLSFESGEEWRLGTAEALVLNLSGANSHGYSVRYFTETA